MKRAGWVTWILLALLPVAGMAERTSLTAPDATWVIVEESSSAVLPPASGKQPAMQGEQERPEEKKSAVPCVPGILPGGCYRDFPVPGEPREAPARRPRVDQVVYLKGERTYPYLSHQPYSETSLARCLPLPLRGDTIVAVRGIRLAPWADTDGMERTVLLVDRRGYRWSLQVDSGDDRELVVRIPPSVKRGLYRELRENVGKLRFQLLGNGQLLAERRVEACDRRFELEVRARYRNCLDPVTTAPGDMGLEVQGFEVLEVRRVRVKTHGTDTLVTWRFAIPEGRRGRLRLDPDTAVCRGGRWTQDVVEFGPAIHGHARVVVNVTHERELVEQRLGVCAPEPDGPDPQFARAIAQLQRAHPWP